MSTFASLLSITLIVGLTCVYAPAQSDDQAVIDKYIAGQAKREHGEEPDGIRKTVEGDINHDGAADVAVLYTIEGQGGSNNYIQYLAVFIRKNGKLVFAARQVVGGKNRREIEITSIKDHAIYFDTTAYGPRDPSCCPTIKGHTKYVLAGSRLIEKRQK
jgi:hypothetical protein